MITRRSAFVVFAAAMAAPIAAFAQAGGLPSTTAPSNSEGTPASRTGVVGTTQVAPATTTRASTRHRRRRHRRHHAAATPAAAQ